MSKQRGVTLLELMVTVAIIAIVSTIAVTAYQGYIGTAREAVLAQNIDTMRVFQEDFRLRTSSYASGEWHSDGSNISLETTIGWTPETTQPGFSYVVVANAGVSYTVTATDANTGTSVTRTFP